MGRNTPQQHNRFDYGMFVAMSLDFLMDDSDLVTFCQLDTEYFQMRLLVDIIHGYLLLLRRTDQADHRRSGRVLVSFLSC
jgi:hypothetical protein